MARKTQANALRADPTRTATVRRLFTGQLRRRYRTVAASVRALALSGALQGRAGTPWQLISPTQRLDAFDTWLQALLERQGLAGGSAISQQWWLVHLRTAYVQGALRGLAQVWRKRGKSVTQEVQRLFLEHLMSGKGSKDLPNILTGNAAWERPRDVKGRFMSERLAVLAAGLASDIKGISVGMSQRMGRLIIQAVTKGSSAQELAAQLVREVDLAAGKAATIARTELSRAHAEGQLDAMESLGVDDVTGLVEWDTTGGACPACEELDGVVLKLDEARGMLPRHPNCRCAWIPLEGVAAKPQQGQIRQKREVQRAIKRSQRKGNDKDDGWGPARDITTRNSTSGSADNVPSTGLMAQTIDTFDLLLRQLDGR